MKKNILIVFYPLSIIFATFFLFLHGCAKETNGKQQPVKHATANMIEMPKRLISDYSGMQEDDTVSWIWMKKGFRLDNCRSFKVYPLKNFSMVDNVLAEKKMQEVLQDIFRVPEAMEGRTVAAGVMAAIVEMKPEKEFVDLFSSSLDSCPHIEIEIVIFDEDSKTILLKLCHSKKSENFDDALQKIVKDIKTFFMKKA